MSAERIDRAGEMEAFVQVVAGGSLSAAARALSVTPSAVSRIIGRLEARLGVRLLVRTTRRLALTPEGEAFHRSAARILEDIAYSERVIADQAAPRGRLRVNATFAYGRLAIVPLMQDFAAQYPGILVELSLNDAIVDLIEDGTDVAIRSGPMPDSGLMVRKLGESGRLVVAAPAYLARHGTPAAPGDLRQHNCIGFTFRRSRTLWPFREDGRDHEVAVTGTIEANNADTVRQLALDGVGIARLGRFHVADDVAAGRLVPLLQAFNPGDRETFHAVFIGGTTIPARVRVFIDVLATRLG